MRYENLFFFLSVAAAAWFLIIYSWPRLLIGVYKRAVLTKGFAGPIPLNTLATAPPELFADPFHSPPSASRLATAGVNHDTILTAGVLDLRDGPRVLHVPAMADRYYGVQLTAPNNTVFAYVGTRATGTTAGTFLITGPGWRGRVPGGMTHIPSPVHSVFVLGRTLVYDDGDLPRAYELAKQIRLAPPSGGTEQLAS